MKTTKYALVAALGLVALVAPRAVWADTIFDVSGTLQDGSILTGTVLIDTTTGIPKGANVETTGPTSVGPLGDVGYSFDQPQFFLVAAQGSNNDDIYLYFDVPNLIGYAGGPLCGLSAPECVSTEGPIENQGPVISSVTDPVYLTSGSVTLPAAVPEPSSVVLLVTGLLGLMASGRTRADSSNGLSSRELANRRQISN